MLSESPPALPDELDEDVPVVGVVDAGSKLEDTCVLG
jgi:hypothetical protein